MEQFIQHDNRGKALHTAALNPIYESLTSLAENSVFRDVVEKDIGIDKNAAAIGDLRELRAINL